MIDVGPASTPEGGSVGEDAEDLLVFVERLAAAGQAEEATSRAREQIGAGIRAGAVPPGLRRLAEALAASVSEIPPAPRGPVDDPGSVVPAMRSNALAVLDGAGPAAVAAAITALVADGRRVVVTAESDAELVAVRRIVSAGRIVDALPTLPAADLRELRRLLATSTVAGRARALQQLPPREHLPAVAEVDELCARADRARAGDRGSMVPGLLADVDPERREAVTAIARCVTARLEALGSRDGRAWEWALLSHLIHTRHRATFDRTLEDIAQAVGIVDRRRTAPPVTFLGPLPADAVDVLCNYLEFLKAGGRARAYFAPSAQREVRPVLRLIRIADREPETGDEVLRVIDHLELGHRLGRIAGGCAEMNVPAPRGPHDLAPLADSLGLVAAAARSVGALRHDVLFLGNDSPLSVPDVAAASHVAAAILEFAENGTATEAAVTLDRLAGELAARVPVAATAPEHEWAVAALRQRDAQGYTEAVEALEAARRAQRDEVRRSDLLDRLRAQSPALAAEWERPGHGFGLACFTRADALLRALPAPDSADVVVVLGAASLGVERLLLTAVAPRMIAAVDPATPAEEAPTLLSVLQRASALVVRGVPGERSGGRVVQFNAGGRSVAGVA